MAILKLASIPCTGVSIKTSGSGLRQRSVLADRKRLHLGASCVATNAGSLAGADSFVGIRR
jgi:hypothetical protein